MEWILFQKSWSLKILIISYQNIFSNYSNNHKVAKNTRKILCGYLEFLNFFKACKA
jgi:hypothetical protein